MCSAPCEMETPSSPCTTDTNAQLPCRTQLISQSPSPAVGLPIVDMKDVSNSTRPPRPAAYPKKRPSPYGVSKSRKQSPLYPPHLVVRKSPRAARADLLTQRQREAQIQALRREGVYLEEEYREEIRFYMHEMEVSAYCDNLLTRLLNEHR